MSSGAESTPTAALQFEVDGVLVTMEVLVDDVPKILAWSTSEVILYLGKNGPTFQEGLRGLFGS